MIDQILPHRVMTVHGKGDFQFGADAVRAGNEDRLAVFFCVERKQSAEPPHPAHHFTATGGSQQLGQCGFDLVTQSDIDSRGSVSFLSHVQRTLPVRPERDKR